MKLLDKYNRLNISATILTFIVGSAAFYFLLHYILIHQLDETLQTEQQEITAYASTHNTLPEIIRTKDQYTSFEPSTGKANTLFLTVKNKIAGENEDLREIQFSLVVAGKNYLIRVDKPLEETESLLQIIIGVTVAMIAMILLIGYFINRVVIRRLWKPFYQAIDQVKTYHLTDQNFSKAEPTDIDEFSLLNQSINDMVERIQQDYESLKNFTGQAAHEIQTPLAVIRTKLDMLVQQESILENSGQHIIDIENALQKLSRLHQSLLLLTKVENRQFALNEEVRLDKIIEDKYEEYCEMAEAMEVHIAISIQPLTIVFHSGLAEIIIGNLFNNAVRYNKPGGSIEIALKDKRLTITNTSANQELDGVKLFKRFYRQHQTDEGNGLGLSIVKQICDMAGYSIIYQYSEGRHRFTIIFAGNF